MLAKFFFNLRNRHFLKSTRKGTNLRENAKNKEQGKEAREEGDSFSPHPSPLLVTPPPPPRPPQARSFARPLNWSISPHEKAATQVSSFFACLQQTITESRPINVQKRRRPLSSHLGRRHLVNKEFNMLKRNTIFFRETAGDPERARVCHPACSGSQSQHWIRFFLPALGESHIIKLGIDLSSCFIACLSTSTPNSSVHKNAEKELRQYQAILTLCFPSNPCLSPYHTSSLFCKGYLNSYRSLPFTG